MTTTLKTERDSGILVVTLNRPEKLNALNRATFDDLKGVLETVAEDDEIKVVVLTGEGRGFCAGGDRDHPAWGTDDNLDRQRFIREAQNITRMVYDLPQPVIAAVNGVAAGAGLDLALACDLRIASEEARFGEVFSRAGVMPDMGGTFFLPRLVGLGKAMEMILLGDILDAREAERVGLVNRVVPAAELMVETLALAGRLAKGPSRAYRLSKWAVHRGLEQHLEAALENELHGQTQLLATHDAREAATAFAEKREPVFEGR